MAAPSAMALRFVALTTPAVLDVTWRRVSRAPRHPAWSWRLEVIITTMRRQARSALTEHPRHLRARVGDAPLFGAIARRVVLEPTEVGPLPAERITPEGWEPGGPIVLYLHGGGYVFGSPGSHRDMMARLAVASGARVVGIDYRLAPEHPFPAALDDCLTAWRALRECGIDTSRLFLGGDSAGGALTLSAMTILREAGEPLPRAALLLSPWVDLTCSGDSVEAHAAYDYLVPDVLRTFARHYLQDTDPKNPLASPLYADLRGLPPILLQVGGAEALVSENRELARRAREAGVQLHLQEWDGMPHGWQGFAALLPEGDRALRAAGAFVRKHFDGRG